VKLMHYFSELRLIMNSLAGSLVSLFWSVIMLFLILCIFGMIFVQAAGTVLEKDEGADAELLMKNFGSVETAIFTLYCAAFAADDWIVYYEAAELLGAFYPGLFLLYMAFIQISLLNVLTGIFVENAMKLAQPDRDRKSLERRQEEILIQRELCRLSVEMDTDATGTISKGEFTDFLQRGKLRAQLSVLGLDIQDAEIFFEVLSHASDGGEVLIEDFVRGCMRLKGLATSIDMQTLLVGFKMLQKSNMKLQDMHEKNNRQINELIRLAGAKIMTKEHL